MATIRRLSDGDVRAVFESVHGNHHPPAHLQFQIVPVGPVGLKLSPPSFEFEDGLYILLKPQKKKKSIHAADQPKVPSNLMPLVMGDMPNSACPWSLSGPQFPQPTAIQQRYCYPKGNPQYSSRKGGALWTMYGTDGKEDLTFRLLHVYFSAKRAVNKGYQVASPMSTPNKRARKLTPIRTPVARSYHQPTSPFLMMEHPHHEHESLHFDSSPFNSFVTPDPGDFGRFHPVPNATGSLNNSPVWSRAVAGNQLHELDAFHLDMQEPTIQELEACFDSTKYTSQHHHLENDSVTGDPIRLFADKLENMHESIKDCILMASHENDQGHFVALVEKWARQVALSPLGESDVSVEKV